MVFLGFQAFTGTISECVKACMRTAENSCGIFVGGAPDIYANEAPAQFEGFSRGLGGCRTVTVKSDLVPEADSIRTKLFDPQCFHQKGFRTKNVHVFEARDITEELEFIAASIKKFVLDGGERYFRISVMLSDVNAYRPVLARVFSQYNIPYYVDERRPLTEHALTAFICDYIECVAGGCAPRMRTPFYRRTSSGLTKRRATCSATTCSAVRTTAEAFGANRGRISARRSGSTMLWYAPQGRGF